MHSLQKNAKKCKICKVTQKTCKIMWNLIG
jgi:hypothetical protein